MSNIFLPKDLLEEVLIRLPVKSLVRFKSVSKLWSTLIGNKEFARLHLNRSLMDPKAYKMIVKITKRNNYKLLAADFDSPENLIATFEKIYHPLEKFEEVPITLIGSCHGLLCIRNIHHGIVLCNPWIKKYRKLPAGWLFLHHSYAYGFGYDDVNDDYKVARICNSISDSLSSVDVYSLKSNSWRQIKKSFPVQIPTGIPLTSGVLVGCSLHWLPMPHDNSCIVAIDLRTEEYRLLPLSPDQNLEVLNPRARNRRARNLGVLHHRARNLGVLKGNLVLFTIPIEKPTEFRIWMMKEYGMKDSWTLLTTVQLRESLKWNETLHVLQFSKNGEEVIFQHSTSNRVVWYDIKNKLVKEAKIPGSEIISHSEKFVEVCTVVCSLVDPDCCGGSERLKPKRGAYW